MSSSFSEVEIVDNMQASAFTIQMVLTIKVTGYQIYLLRSNGSWWFTTPVFLISNWHDCSLEPYTRIPI